MDIRRFWRDILDQDAAAIRCWFHPDAIIRWHCSNEQFSVEEFIRANCEYPGQWDGEVERIEQTGDLIITATRVWPRDKSYACHAVSFIQIKDEKIIAMDEYWGDDGPAPQWRQDMHIGTSIK